MISGGRVDFAIAHLKSVYDTAHKPTGVLVTMSYISNTNVLVRGYLGDVAIRSHEIEHRSNGLTRVLSM